MTFKRQITRLSELIADKIVGVIIEGSIIRAGTTIDDPTITGGTTISTTHDTPAVNGGTIIGSTIETASSGNRAVIRSNGSGFGAYSVLEFWAGLAGEEAATITQDVQADGSGNIPVLTISGGSTPVEYGSPVIQMRPTDIRTSGTPGGWITVFSDRFDITGNVTATDVDLSGNLTVNGNITIGPRALSKLNWNIHAYATDANGIMIIAHGLGVVPSMVTIESFSSARLSFRVTARDSNSFSVEIWRIDVGVIYANSPGITVGWLAVA